jgi:quinol monooxygenase YgiN
MKKKCNNCGKKKELEQGFHKNARSPDGFQVRCKECMIALNKGRYKKKSLTEKLAMAEHSKAKRKLLQAQINALKAEKGCLYCSEKDPCCLQFHHTRDNKEGNVAHLANAKSPKVWTEIDKCELVCANCHFKIHAGKLRNS